MNRTRYLFKNLSILNILLSITILIILNYLLVPSFKINIEPPVPSNKKSVPVEENNLFQAKEFPSPVEYNIIPDENLFHPERKIPVTKPVEKPLPKPELILYGTLITSDTRVAYVEDKKEPLNTPGRGKRQIPLKIGDVVSGFVVKEISHDRIVMYRGNEKLVVTIYESKGHKHKETQDTGQPTTPQPQNIQKTPDEKPKTHPNPNFQDRFMQFFQ